MKYIFVSGGVISGIGKGIATASIGLLLNENFFDLICSELKKITVAGLSNLTDER